MMIRIVKKQGYIALFHEKFVLFIIYKRAFLHFISVN